MLKVNNKVEASVAWHSVSGAGAEAPAPWGAALAAPRGANPLPLYIMMFSESCVVGVGYKAAP